ncbi:MAG TPA: 3-phosphoshikimate 1-carboxyvinyltransferase [Acidimicrobiales bacterium]|nr:3-phosphoshikimate 1-carboxyvinyltransferase [Acidimicrobiales bacterium]
MLIEPLVRPPDAVIDVPGSKSITNRALLVAGLASGTTLVRGALLADDTEAMVEAVAALGATVTLDGDVVVVTGTGGVVSAGPPIEARQAATVGRFVPAVLAAGAGERIVGADDQLRRRPMGVLWQALRDAGAEVVGLVRPDHLPVSIRGRAVGGAILLPGDVSSQFVSALLLAGPLYERGVELTVSTPMVSRPYVSMTAAVMSAFGVEVGVAGQGYSVGPASYLSPGEYPVEPDASSASYFFAAAAMTGGRVRVHGLGRNSLQGDLEFVRVLERMGAEVEIGDSHVEVAGRVGEGVDVDLGDFSDMVPTLAVVATAAASPTTIRGVGFVRGKESDRIGAVVTELRRLGIDANELEDGLVVHPGPASGGSVETYGDHRMAMAFALLGLVVPGIDISGPECVVKTFPNYFAVLDRLRS